MRSSLVSLTAAAQSVKAQTLSTLMATLNAVQGVSGASGNAADNQQARLQSAEAQVKATLVSLDIQGKATLEVAGVRVEAQLPPDLLKAGAKNPDLLRPGVQLRLPAEVPARVLASPATRVEVQATPTGAVPGTSVAAAAPLASPYPAGSLGAAISRLTGIALPGAEAAVTATPPGALPPLPAVPPALRPGLVTHIVQPEILSALVHAAGRQVPLAQGLNALLSLSPEALVALPPGVQDVIKTLAQMRSAPADLASPEGLARAVSQSGVFLESHLAAPASAGGTAPAPDFKALLLSLRALLGAPPAPTAPAGSGGGLAQAAALLLGELPLPEGSKPALPNPAPVAARAEAAPTASPSQPAHTPALPEIQRAVDGAVERIKLSQLASLPEHPDITVTDSREQPLRLSVSLPLAPQGHDRPTTAVLGMVIERQPVLDKPAPPEVEDEAPAAGTEGFPWKVRIALDLEDTGPVQAEIALRGQSVGVTFWAERSAMAEAARREIGTLHKALTQAAFDVVTLEVRDGFPHARTHAQTPVLDRRT